MNRLDGNARTSTPNHNLPLQTTHFIGREGELAEMARLLADPNCRLLTLVGPGGIGKTRLAVEIAARHSDPFADGIYFVPLQPLQSPDQIVLAVMSALNLQQSAPDPRENLLNYLAGKRLLLVMDNFEHLLDGAALLADILAEAPQVKIVATSRESLKLSGEWLREVRGLEYPDDGVTSFDNGYSAVQLFVERAQHLRGNLDFDAQAAHIIHVCQLVEGMPLALELAASWVKTLTVREIAGELQTDHDILAARTQDLPERHRSMQAVFDHSWRLLTEEEQTVLRRMSVFRGGCTREAAEQVTGATLHTLAALVEKSLLRHDAASGRYDMQELLRQYAASELAVDAAEQEHVLDRHCDYYARFVLSHMAQIYYGDEREILAEIDNLRSAWTWAVDHRKLAEINDMTEGLAYFYDDRLGWIHEFRAQFERAVAALAMAEPAGEQGIVYGHVLAAYGMAVRLCGHGEQGEDLITTGLDILRRLAAPGPVLVSGLQFGNFVSGSHAAQIQMATEFVAVARELGEQWRVAQGLYLLGFWYLEASKYDAAHSYLSEMLGIARTLDNPLLVGSALTRLGDIACRVGDYEYARQCLEEALQRLGTAYPVRRMVCLWLLGILKTRQERYTEAEQRYQASLAIAETIGRDIFVGRNLSGLALLAAARGDHAQAQQLAGECMTIHQAHEGPQGIVETQVLMGLLAVKRGDRDDAVRHFTQALRMGEETGILAITLEVVIGFALLTAAAGDRERAVELLAVGFPIEWDTDGGLERKPVYERLRDDLRAAIPPASFQAAWARGEERDPQVTANQLVARFSPQDEDAAWAINLTLVDPLTRREFEVLGLLAQGLSNAQIGERMFITTGTVKRYTNRIYAKLDVTTRIQAAAQARKMGLI